MSSNFQHHLSLEQAMKAAEQFVEWREFTRNSKSLAAYTPLSQDLYNALCRFDIDTRFGLGNIDSIFIYRNQKINFKDIPHENIHREDITLIRNWFFNMVNKIKNYHT